MAGIPIEKLHLSVRTNNVLHRMGINYVSELAATSVEEIAQQRNVGTKTLDEIKNTLEGIDSIDSSEIPEEGLLDSNVASMFTEEQLSEMSRHLLEELHLSVRPYNAMKKSDHLTIAQIAILTESDFAQIKGLGKKSIDEIKQATANWLANNLIFQEAAIANHDEIDIGTKEIFQQIAEAIKPIVHVYWKKLYSFAEQSPESEIEKSSCLSGAIEKILRLPELRPEIEAFWFSVSSNQIIDQNSLAEYLLDMHLSFDYRIIVDSAIETGLIVRYRNCYLLHRDNFIDAIDKYCDPKDRTTQILQLRTEGESLQDIGDIFDLTRERIRQISKKAVRRFLLLFEDYFSEPYMYFHFSNAQFIGAFPDISEEGAEYLSLRYQKGDIDLNEDTLNKYTGAWKDRLEEFLQEEAERIDKRTVSRTEMVMRVLISNSDTALTIEEFEKEYYRYIERKGFPIERLRINTRSVGNHLRNSRGIVFNRDNKVRYCNADLNKLCDEIDFSPYKNTVISTELVFRDYADVMDEFDVRDGYELFYLIKAASHMQNIKEFNIKCRRVPIIIIGEGSEEKQAVKLLKEISPVEYLNYFEAYEERYGVRKESAPGNSTITNALAPYYIDGQYVIDVPSINDIDVPQFLHALSHKKMWFVDELDELFNTYCIHSERDAINEAAFRRIGYTLHAGYAYISDYGSVTNFLDKEIFDKDIIDLTTLDRRLINLSMFGSTLAQKKRTLEFIETAPKILMSISKVEERYGLSREDIQDIQREMSAYCKFPFFNGHSIWGDVAHLPMIEKLQGNDWMLTCIIRQQDEIASLSVAGGIILSTNSEILSLSRICEWLVSIYGKMTINALDNLFNDKFGTDVTAYKLAEKLKSSGLWEEISTDSMDDYIERLVDEDLLDVDDLLAEEFF